MKKKKKIMITAVLLLIIIAIIGITRSNDDYGKIDWDTIELAEILPEPPSLSADILVNSSEELSIDIEKISIEDFNDYIKKCKDFGFTIDSEKSSDSFSAYNKEGYYIDLMYWESSEKLDIDCNAPLKLEEISWPTSELAKTIPAPKSAKGVFSYEYEDSFSLKIGETSKLDFNDYIKACSDNGYTKDYEKGESYYRAYNDNGNYLSLEYLGFNTMSISLEKEEVDDKIDTDTTTEKTTEQEESITIENKDDSNSSNTDLRPEFKKYMDSYEEFMNEYVDFLNKYNEDPSDLSLLADYAEYMNDYADMVEEFEDWEDEELNDAEAIYYAQVQLRVVEKLNELE